MEVINNLSKGYIFILEGAINSEVLDQAKIDLIKFTKKNKAISPKIKTGIKNGYYISRNLSSKGYKAVDQSFYFFSWNKDKLGIYKKNNKYL